MYLLQSSSADLDVIVQEEEEEPAQAINDLHIIMCDLESESEEESDEENCETFNRDSALLQNKAYKMMLSLM